MHCYANETDEMRLIWGFQLLREVIELRADFTEAYLTRGDLLLRHNRTTEAVRMYERAAAIDQDNPDTHYNVSKSTSLIHSPLVLSATILSQSFLFVSNALNHRKDLALFDWPRFLCMSFSFSTLTGKPET